MPDHVHAPARLPAPRHPYGSYRVSLVCLGNICRSPTAEIVLREELVVVGLAGTVEVDSSGTGDWHLGGQMDPGARAELAARGYDGSRHRARQFDRSWFSRYDLIVAMDRNNLSDLRRMAPDKETATERIRLLRSFDPELAAERIPANRAGGSHDDEIPDPYHGTPEDYGLAFDLVKASVIGLAAQLAELLGDRAASRPDL